MGKIQTEFVNSLADAVGRGSIEAKGDELAKFAAELMEDISDESASVILDAIKKYARAGLRRNRRARRGFEKRLWNHWKRPLSLLELTVEIAQEIGVGIAEEFKKEAGTTKDHTFIALSGNHTRACQMARAILALLRSGFADDAHARWRSLHELAIVSFFISTNGADVAERYLLHETVQQRKLAKDYQKHQARANLDPLGQEEIDELDRRYESLIARFGKEFGSDYGWAASALGKRSPRLIDIEEHVRMDHLRPYYRMASDNVHANAHGAFYRMGMGLDGNDRGVLLAGASNMGLADPGHGTAMSLMQVTAAFVESKPTLDSLIELKVLQLLEDGTGQAFLQAHQAAERIAREKRLPLWRP